MRNSGTEIAYAKLNLALHVRARQADGYHQIETLFAFVDDGDRLSVAPSSALTLTIAGEFADDLDGGEDDLVLRAARLLQERAAIPTGAALHLEKQLPVASGIGGGSADAAATLRLLARHWHVAPDIDLASIAAELGADVPACLRATTSIGTGIGTDLSDTPDLSLTGTAALLVNPLFECPTAAVFSGWDQQDRGPLDPLDYLRSRNDLTTSAMHQVPEIVEVLTVLRAQVPRLARMSGSGATCFALFRTAAERDAAATRIASSHPEWWQMAGALR